MRDTITITTPTLFVHVLTRTRLTLNVIQSSSLSIYSSGAPSHHYLSCLLLLHSSTGNCPIFQSPTSYCDRLTLLNLILLTPPFANMNKLFVLFCVAFASLDLSHPTTFGHTSTKVKIGQRLNRNIPTKVDLTSRSICKPVFVWSKTFERKKLLKWGFKKLQKTPNFSTSIWMLCSNNERTTRIKKIKGNKYRVSFCCTFGAQTPFSSIPKFSVPSVPKFSAPSVPKFSAPSVPKFSVPSTSKFSVPSASKFPVPSAPKFSVPSVPKFSLPSVPKFTTTRVRSFPVASARPSPL